MANHARPPRLSDIIYLTCYATWAVAEVWRGDPKFSWVGLTTFTLNTYPPPPVILMWQPPLLKTPVNSTDVVDGSCLLMIARVVSESFFSHFLFAVLLFRFFTIIKNNFRCRCAVDKTRAVFCHAVVHRSSADTSRAISSCKSTLKPSWMVCQPRWKKLPFGGHSRFYKWLNCKKVNFCESFWQYFTGRQMSFVSPHYVLPPHLSLRGRSWIERRRGSKATRNLYSVGKIYIASALLYRRGLCVCFSGQAWR